MDKKEFLEKLAMALAGQVSRRVIEENIAYYDQYISDEMRRGKTVSPVSYTHLTLPTNSRV